MSQYATKSGFWEEKDFNNHCLGKEGIYKEIHISKQKIMSKDVKFSEEDEFQAIEEIMEALDTRKIDFQSINSEVLIAQLVDDWATEIFKNRLKMEHRNDATNKILAKWAKRYGSKDTIEEYLVLEACTMMRNRLCQLDSLLEQYKLNKNVCEDGVNEDATSEYRFKEELKKYCEIIKTRESPILSSKEFPGGNSTFESDEYLKKYDFSICYDELQHFDIFPFTNVTITNSRGEKFDIPTSEINQIFERCYNKKEELIKEQGEHSEVASQVMTVKETYKARQFDNLQIELAKEREKKSIKQQMKKTDLSTRIKMRQK